MAFADYFLIRAGVQTSFVEMLEGGIAAFLPCIFELDRHGCSG